MQKRLADSRSKYYFNKAQCGILLKEFEILEASLGINSKSYQLSMTVKEHASRNNKINRPEVSESFILSSWVLIYVAFVPFLPLSLTVPFKTASFFTLCLIPLPILPFFALSHCVKLSIPLTSKCMFSTCFVHKASK